MHFISLLPEDISIVSFSVSLYLYHTHLSRLSFIVVSKLLPTVLLWPLSLSSVLFSAATVVVCKTKSAQVTLPPKILQ